MKRHGNLYDKICDLENIKLAHKNARKGKKKRNGQPYDEIVMIDADLDKYCLEISEMLRNKEFVNSKYTMFTVNDRGKTREIYKLPYYPDRIIHHAIMQILEPIWRKVLIADTYQAIKGRGIHKAIKKMNKVIKTAENLYYLQVDVSKFYPSVDNEILKMIIRKKLKCQDTLWLLDTIIDSIKGLPIGNYISQYFGNLYLNELDRYMKEVVKVKHYYRYCDDIVILSIDKAELHKYKFDIIIALDELNLSIKNNHKVSKIQEGLNFLGVVQYGSYTLLRKKIASNIKKSEERSLPSYEGLATIANCYNLLKTRRNK